MYAYQSITVENITKSAKKKIEIGLVFFKLLDYISTTRSKYGRMGVSCVTRIFTLTDPRLAFFFFFLYVFKQARRMQGSRLRKSTLEGDWPMVVNLITKNLSRQHHLRFLYAVYRQVGSCACHGTVKYIHHRGSNRPDAIDACGRQPRPPERVPEGLAGNTLAVKTLFGVN